MWGQMLGKFLWLPESQLDVLFLTCWATWHIRHCIMGANSVEDKACFHLASLGSMNEVTVENGACDGTCEKYLNVPLLGGGYVE